DGGTAAADAAIVAVPWRQAKRLLPEAIAGGLPEIQAAPITSLHLWFDRVITELPHAVLVGRLSQWVFARGQGSGDRGQMSEDHYYQVVVSASHDLGGRQRDEVLREVRTDLAAVFPAARDAELVRWRMITEQEAVFS